jgi:hypothetical protein
VSTGLCHTANVSHLAGRGLRAGEIAEQVNGHPPLAEAFGRMAEHLAANGIDLAKTPVTLGLPLTVDPQAQRFAGPGAGAANAFLRREYRAPFVVPELA